MTRVCQRFHSFQFYRSCRLLEEDVLLFTGCIYVVADEWRRAVVEKTSYICFYERRVPEMWERRIIWLERKIGELVEASTLMVGIGSSTDRRVLIELAEKLGVNNDTLNHVLHHDVSKTTESDGRNGGLDNLEDFFSPERSRRWGSWAAVIDTSTAGLVVFPIHFEFHPSESRLFAVFV